MTSPSPWGRSCGTGWAAGSPGLAVWSSGRALELPGMLGAEHALARRERARPSQPRGRGEGLADGARRTGADGRDRPGPGRAGACRWRAGLPAARVRGRAGPVGLGAGPVAAWPRRGVAARLSPAGPLPGAGVPGYARAAADG